MIKNYVVCLPSYFNTYNVIVFNDVKSNINSNNELQFQYNKAEYFTTSKKFKSIIYSEYCDIPGIVFNTQFKQISYIFNHIFKTEKNKKNKKSESFTLLYIGDYIKPVEYEVSNSVSDCQSILYTNKIINIPSKVEIHQVFKTIINESKYQRLLDIILNNKFKNNNNIVYSLNQSNEIVDNSKNKQHKLLNFLLHGVKLTNKEKQILYKS